MIEKINQTHVRTALESALAQGSLSLPEACRAIRGLRGLSQAALAEEMGVSVKVVKTLESGKGNPRLSSLNQLAEVAGLEVRIVDPDARDYGVKWPRFA